MSSSSYTEDTLVQQTTTQYPELQPDRESVCTRNSSPKDGKKFGEKFGEKG